MVKPKQIAEGFRSFGFQGHIGMDIAEGTKPDGEDLLHWSKRINRALDSYDKRMVLVERKELTTLDRKMEMFK